jgi:hypothetical protein
LVKVKVKSEGFGNNRMRKLMSFSFHQMRHIIRAISLRRSVYEEHAESSKEVINAYRIFVEKSENKTLFVKSRIW